MTLERGDSPLAGRRPAPLRSVAGLSAINSMSSMNSMSGVGTGHAPVSASPIGTLGSISSMGTMGSMSGSGSVGTQTPGSGQVPSTTSLGQGSSFDGRNSSASFWLELKGVERWFDTLEPHERVTLMASLFARSPERQLQQYSSTIDKALRSQTSPANLSRFGVGQNNQNNDLASVYRYRSPLSAGASSGHLGAGPPSSNTTTTTTTTTSTVSGGGSAVVSTSANGDTAGIRPIPTKSVKTPSSVRAGPSGSGHSVSQTDQSSAGYVAPLSFTSNASHATDLYSQAFLPLPRTQGYGQGYSPWGTEIRRPNSAAADAWPDKTRSSPTLQSVGNTGSPNISNLSLDTPHPFGSGPSASASTASPIGHPLKPWRTFTPHQNPIGSGIGLAPDSGQSQRRTIPHSSPSSPPSTRSPALPTGLAPGSVPLSSTMSSVHLPGSESVQGSGDEGSSSSNSSNDSSGGRGFAASNNGGAHPSNSTSGSIGSSRSGSMTPKDNRLARRSVNIVDVELLSDIGAWLRSLRLHKYTGNLSGMKWQDVIQLNDQDLEDRGVNALGARRKLLKMFEEIRTAQEAGQLPDE